MILKNSPEGDVNSSSPKGNGSPLKKYRGYTRDLVT